MRFFEQNGVACVCYRVISLSGWTCLLTGLSLPPHLNSEQRTAALLTVSSLMGASAFVAPAPKFSRTRGVARMSFEGEAGVTAPLGYWVRESSLFTRSLASPRRTMMSHSLTLRP